MKIEQIETEKGTRFARVEELAINPKDIPTGELPVGRVSIDGVISFSTMISELAGEFGAVNARFPIEYLELMQNLSIVNPDVSQAVDNIVQLGNTGHKVIIENDSEAEHDNILNELNDFAQYAFKNYGGLEGFTNSLFAQTARGGAGSVEWVPNADLSGVKEVVFVPLETVRFAKDQKTGTYKPWQKVSDLQFGQKGMIQLNSHTYQYCALQLLDNSPYAVPPILAALESIMIQRDIIKNFKFAAKKMGLLGFVTFLLKAPTQKPGETETAYKSRLTAFLGEQAKTMKENYRDGIAVGFKDNMTIEHHSVSSDANNATQILQQIEQQVFSGLKADPAMHGRSYSTTETYAGVVYEKMLSIITNYQRIVRQVLEYGYKLHLSLKGYDYGNLYLEFEPTKSMQSERDETTYQTKITTLRNLYQDGIISQQTYAHEAGYDSPDLPGPRPIDYGVNGVGDGSDTPPADTAQQSMLKFNCRTGRYTSSKKAAPKLIALTAEGDFYHEPEIEFESLWDQFMDVYYPHACKHDHCGHDRAQLADNSKIGKQLKRYMEIYFRKVFPSIRGSRLAAVRDVINSLKNIDLTNMDSDLFSSVVMRKLESSFGQNLDESPLASRVREQVQTSYKYFRIDDTTPFLEKRPIAPSFNLVDRKAIKFMRSSDEFYFGRYISDPSTKRGLKSWLEDEYLQSGRSLRDPGELNKFREKFGNRVAKEDFKVLRVVETSVSRAKNWGNALQVHEAKATTIRIAGPVDNVSCDWCEGMVDQEFEVAPVVSQIQSVLDADPEDLPALSPFLPGKIHPDALNGNTSSESLLAQGIALPPYHPHCRHRFVVSGFED